MGLQLAEPQFHTRCYVEWDDYPQNVLMAAMRAGYMAPAPIWDDVTTFDGLPMRGAISQETSDLTPSIWEPKINTPPEMKQGSLF